MYVCMWGLEFAVSVCACFPHNPYRSTFQPFEMQHIRANFLPFKGKLRLWNLKLPAQRDPTEFLLVTKRYVLGG